MRQITDPCVHQICDQPVSARLKALAREVECVVQVARSCVRNAFELHAGMEFIRIAVFGQLLGNVLQRRCIRRINQRSKVTIGLLPRLCPEPRAASKTAPCSTK